MHNIDQWIDPLMQLSGIKPGGTLLVSSEVIICNSYLGYTIDKFKNRLVTKLIEFHVYC